MKLKCFFGEHEKVYIKVKEVLYDASLGFAVDYIKVYWKCRECKKIGMDCINGGVTFTVEELNKKL